MSYLVFARKFRPQIFDEVVGQEPIVTTLKNAITQERIPQNFIFSGPRGCGKTSTARILAKALNCAKGPTEKPCGKCNACVEITQSNSLDVLEIDGASNRGIDEIRNLRETVKFKPTSGRFRIYIIDEVHMLTTEAFNALLKTLEEPPTHVKFIFATTEAHKVPLTILSRCHRFHFKRIPTAGITEKLTEIAKAEKLKFEKNALFEIAKASEGSLRDAESLLDQLASFSDGIIKEEDVLLALGLASEEVYFSTLDSIHQKDVKKIFTLVSDLYDGGRDLVQYAKGLLEIFRHLLVLQFTDKAGDFIEISAEGLEGLKKRKTLFSRGEILFALSLLGNLQGQLRRNLANPKLLVETALLKLMHLEGLEWVDDMLSGSARQAAAMPQQPAVRPNMPSSPAPAARPSSMNSSSYSSPAAAPKTVSSPASAKPSVSAAVSVQDGPLGSIDDVMAIWPRVIDFVKTKRMSIGIFLSESSPIEVTESAVILGLPAEFQFHKEMLDKDINRRLVEEGFEVIWGRKTRVQIVVTKPEDRRMAPASASEPSPEDSQLPEIINEALQIFDGAKIVRKD